MPTLSKRPHQQQRELNHGNKLHQHGRLLESTAAYTDYTRHYPADKTGHYNLAVTLEAARQPDAAMQAYRRALEIDPWYPEALNNLGILLHDQGSLDAAKICYARAMAARPGYDDAEYNFATAESNCGNFEEAVTHLSRLLARNPRRADAWNNLANVLMALRAPAEALQAFQLALSLQPDLPDAEWNAASAQLTLGHLPEGWRGFEQRGKPRHASLPRWDGSEIKDKSILVHAEQGLGDTIQFLRYCREVKTVTSAQVILECHPELISLLHGTAGVDHITGFSTESPSFEVDYQIPLMSLPLVFGTSVDTIPSIVPYLNVDAALIEKWGKRMAAPERHLKIGLVWSGNPAHRNDRNRSIDINYLDVLGHSEGVAFYCLQQKPQSAALSRLESLSFRGVFDELTFTDTAAILFNLDLLISVDTVVAHLAGALGRPVWTLLPYAPDWRWMLHRSDTPWYPSMRLFRQLRLNDWTGVLKQVAAELSSLQLAHQIV